MTLKPSSSSLLNVEKSSKLIIQSASHSNDFILNSSSVEIDKNNKKEEKEELIQSMESKMTITNNQSSTSNVSTTVDESMKIEIDTDTTNQPINTSDTESEQNWNENNVDNGDGNTKEEDSQVEDEIDDEDKIMDCNGNDQKNSTIEQKFPDSDAIKMFVGQIPKIWNESDCHKLFKEFGEIYSLKVLRDKESGQSRGCCFVTFFNRKSALSAQDALHNVRTLEDMHNPIQMKPADSENKQERKIFIGMLSKKFNEIDVRQMFTRFGNIEECLVLRDLNGNSRGCAFVTFSTKQCAINSIKTIHNSITMDGCSSPIVVKLASNNIQQQQITSVNARKLVPRISNGTKNLLNKNHQHSLFLHPAHSCIVHPTPQFVSLAAAAAAAVAAAAASTSTTNNNINMTTSNSGSSQNMNSTTDSGSGSSVVSSGSSTPASHGHPHHRHYHNHNYSKISSYHRQSNGHRDKNGPYLAHQYNNSVTSPSSSLFGSSTLGVINNNNNVAGKSIINNGGILENQSTIMNSAAVVNKQPEGPEGANLFIYHLPSEFGDFDLTTMFSSFGNILSAKVFVDRYTNLSKCFGFVSYDNPSSAHAAIHMMNGFQIGPKRLKLPFLNLIHENGNFRLKHVDNELIFTVSNDDNGNFLQFRIRETDNSSRSLIIDGFNTELNNIDDCIYRIEFDLAAANINVDFDRMKKLLDYSFHNENNLEIFPVLKFELNNDESDLLLPKSIEFDKSLLQVFDRPNPELLNDWLFCHNHSHHEDDNNVDILSSINENYGPLILDHIEQIVHLLQNESNEILFESVKNKTIVCLSDLDKDFYTTCEDSKMENKQMIRIKLQNSLLVWYKIFLPSDISLKSDAQNHNDVILLKKYRMSFTTDWYLITDDLFKLMVDQLNMNSYQIKRLSLIKNFIFNNQDFDNDECIHDQCMLSFLPSYSIITL
ncbi:cugbp elav-like protein family member 2-like protein [Dermatophagoides farinae]|uniref:Cugbp elav-like protein family member 2-like protein n=1 Tax=Dermatophagoides farinae TaxID=6954 RepID=A0A9D4P7Q7_DERFA|nr:cugbp elav-like protein family member 2-like protein [Dermatophagoides farinae]